MFDTTIIPKRRTSHPGPQWQPESEAVSDNTSSAGSWLVLLFNDEVHDFATVIVALQRGAGLSLELAEAVTLEAHHQGQAIVRSGYSRDEALISCAAIARHSRCHGRFPGLHCEARQA